jgi:hypothetical protein
MTQDLNPKLSKEQAIEEMRKGLRIRFHSWWWGRYIKIRGSMFVSEKGQIYTPDEILTANHGWQIYDESRDGEHNES